MKRYKKISHWDEIAEWWDTTAKEEGMLHQRLDVDPVLLALLGTVKSKKILEVGCGNGYMARKLAQAGAKVTATDYSKKFISLAQKTENENPSGANFFVVNAENLERFKTASFDMVVSNLCLIDVKNVVKAIAEVGRVLKSKGSFVFSITHPSTGDISQVSSVVTVKGKKYLARSSYAYLSEFHSTIKFADGGFEVIQYHRPLSTYFKLLKLARFTISDLEEIATKQSPKKVSNAAEAVNKRSKYFSTNDKKMKDVATKELPIFMVIKAVKQ